MEPRLFGPSRKGPAIFFYVQGPDRTAPRIIGSAPKRNRVKWCANRLVPAGSPGTQKVRCIYILHNFAQSDENSPTAAASPLPLLSAQSASVCALCAVHACVRCVTAPNGTRGNLEPIRSSPEANGPCPTQPRGTSQYFRTEPLGSRFGSRAIGYWRIRATLYLAAPSVATG